MTVTGKGKYTGATKATYKINPKGTSIAKATPAKKAFTVKWKKQSAKMATSRITGYQIQYCPDKTFKTGNKSVSINSASTVSKVIGGLTKGKTYYVRVRTYKTAGSTKYFSAWGAVKSVKISK